MKLAGLFILFSAAGSLSAQVFEIGASFGVSQLVNSDIGSDVFTTGAPPTARVRLNNGFRFGFRVALNTYRFMGWEFGYAYNRTQLHLDGPPVTEQGMAIHQGFGDGLIYATPEGSRIRPFVAAGLNFSNFVPPGASATYGGGQTKFGFNYGGGVKVKVDTNWMLRFDFRQYETGKPFGLPNASGRLFQNEISAGFEFAL